MSAKKPSERILVRGVNWLGDAVMTTPALQRLREARPSAHITLLTASKLAKLYHHHPAVDRVLEFSANESVLSVGRRLRAEPFTEALLLPNSSRTGFEAWLGRIPRRIGYRRPWRNWLLTHRIEERAGVEKMRKRTPSQIQDLIRNSPSAARHSYSEKSHHLFDYLHLVAQGMGANETPLPPHLEVTAQEISDFHREHPRTSTPWLGLNIGAEYGPAKRWPLEHWVGLVDLLRQSTPATWVIFGGKADAPLAGQLESRLHALNRPGLNMINLAAKTDLRSLCVALKCCHTLFTNDTGPMHLAAAVGTRVVVPFGSTSPELTGPGFPGDRRHALILGQAACAPCFLRECPIDFRCMKSITPEDLAVAFKY